MRSCICWCAVACSADRLPPRRSAAVATIAQRRRGAAAAGAPAAPAVDGGGHAPLGLAMARGVHKRTLGRSGGYSAPAFNHGECYSTAFVHHHRCRRRRRRRRRRRHRRRHCRSASRKRPRRINDIVSACGGGDLTPSGGSPRLRPSRGSPVGRRQVTAAVARERGRGDREQGGIGPHAATAASSAFAAAAAVMRWADPPRSVHHSGRSSRTRYPRA